MLVCLVMCVIFKLLGKEWGYFGGGGNWLLFYFLVCLVNVIEEGGLILYRESEE